MSDRTTPQRAIDAVFAFIFGDPRARVKSYGICGPNCQWPKQDSEWLLVPINDVHGDCL